MGRNKQKQKQQATKNKKTKTGKKQGNPEIIRRLNHLQEVSQIMAGEDNPILSSFYGNYMKNLAKKCVWRLEPKIKRNFCKRCSTALDPNTTCELELVESNNVPIFSFINCLCKTCGSLRKFILNPNHKLWDKNPPFILEMYQKFQNRNKTPDLENVHITENLPEKHFFFLKIWWIMLT